MLMALHVSKSNTAKLLTIKLQDTIFWFKDVIFDFMNISRVT